MGKIFNQKIFNYLVWKLLSSRVSIKINFFLQVLFKVSAVLYCFHYLPTVLLTPETNMPRIALTPLANLPSVSTTPMVIVAKFATDVVDTSSNLPPVLLTPVANLPALSTLYAINVLNWHNLEWLESASGSGRPMAVPAGLQQCDITQREEKLREKKT
jgi:hypothetical protein